MEIKALRIFVGVCKTIKLKLLLQFENNCQIMQMPPDCQVLFNTPSQSSQLPLLKREANKVNNSTLLRQPANAAQRFMATA